MRVRKILLFAAMGAFCALFAALIGFTGSMLFVSAEEADEEQPPCVHSWDAGAVTTEPSCTVNGIRTYTCTLCGETREEYIAALGHIYETSVTKEPTCTTTGIMRSICARCLHAFNEVIPATAHNYESVQETSDAETYCPDTKFTCSECGTYYYESTGTTERTAHDISNAGSSLTVAATCLQDGQRSGICRLCGEQGTVVVEALGHDWIFDSQRFVVFELKLEQHYYCSRCNEEMTEEIFIEDLASEPEADTQSTLEYVAEYYQNSIYEPYRNLMLMLFGILAGIWSIPIGVSYIIARKQDDKERARKMLVNFVVGIVIIFAILVAAPFIVSIFMQLILALA